MAGTGKIYVKKVYPIKGRRDFFKYVVMDSGKIGGFISRTEYGLLLFRSKNSLGVIEDLWGEGEISDKDYNVSKRIIKAGIKRIENKITEWDESLIFASKK